MTREQILESNFTKTKKACMLFELGYTRTDVAAWVTNGNYGFAHNIWKKWNDQRTGQTPSIEAQPFEFNFDRSFGIELEIYGASRARLISEFAAQGIRLVDEAYNHNTRNYWKVVSDSSISGENGNEIVSPVLRGQDGIEQIKKVCIALAKAGAKVNNSCGFHLHLGASDLNLENFKNLIKSHIEVEAGFDSIVPNSRRANNNHYCKSLTSAARSKQELLTKINAAGSINELVRIFNTRYLKLNLQSFTRQGTVEFRHHSGTTTFSKIRNWIMICARLVEYTKANGITNNLNHFTNESLQDYISDRAVDLAA